MGEAQGAACRDAIRTRLSAAGIAGRGRLPTSLRPFVAGRVLGAGMGREIARHYPHLSERIQGLADGSGLAIDALMEMFVRASRDELAGEVLAAEAAVATRAGEHSRLVRALPEFDWVLRRSRPEVGFVSVEITLPWLATSVAGVNEAGVAVAVDPRPRLIAASAGTAPSALLLVQECLQRFDDVTGCLDWSLKRPVSGAVRLVVGDASGRVAAIHIDGGERTIAEIHAATDGELGELDKGVVLDPRARTLQLRVSSYDQASVRAS
jgi:hypothetical protein